jgi:CTP:molybdopterin cytidylyltransferase MocA
VTSVAGVLLAAGAGRRMGGPKALLHDDSGVPFLDRAIGALLEGGCASVTVVLGASAEEAETLLADAGWRDDAAVDVVVADDWATGMGASLRAGLDRLGAREVAVPAALVNLVDLPDVGAEVVRRVLAAGPLSGSGGGASALAAEDPGVLARAAYDGRPGHPVLIGRQHWRGVAVAASGDRGARDYLADRTVRLVECGDLASGRDVDHPHDL